MSRKREWRGGKPREVHDREWRDPALAAHAWPQEERTDRELLRMRVRGAFWETLAESGITLLVTREYEHLLVGLCVADGTPRVTYWPMPHPSGLTVDRKRGVVHVASTRNPNQIYDFTPAVGLITRLDSDGPSREDKPLVPTRARFFPGCLYIHDLALIGGKLHANAVGENAVVRIGEDGSTTRVWWPRCIETPRGPIFGCNHLQLNSIAAGKDLKSSYFSASAEGISARRPGHRNFPVKGLGVIFSGATREPIVRGLTRPHSARLAVDGTLWAADSGYGHLVVVRDGGFEKVAALPGWTRGLTIHTGIAYVGTSRVIPRFRQYAPGLDLERSLCGIHAVHTRSGRVLGSLLWPGGNQIFGVEWAPRTLTGGFPFSAKGRRSHHRDTRLFYAFQKES
jgi:uncharacterized protein (TIGR03032 family)